jgi:hypothetical protein
MDKARRGRMKRKSLPTEHTEYTEKEKEEGMFLVWIKGGGLIHWF